MESVPLDSNSDSHENQPIRAKQSAPARVTAGRSASFSPAEVPQLRRILGKAPQRPLGDSRRKKAGGWRLATPPTIPLAAALIAQAAQSAYGANVGRKDACVQCGGDARFQIVDVNALRQGEPRHYFVASLVGWICDNCAWARLPDDVVASVTRAIAEHERSFQLETSDASLVLVISPLPASRIPVELGTGN